MSSNEQPSPDVKRPFTDAFLTQYSAEHVRYEIDMFFECVELRTRPGFTTQALAQLGNHQLVNSALIESFVVHLRNLIDFLYLESPGKTDVVAKDFIATGVWESIRPVETESLKRAKERANKEISHLTSKRIADTHGNKDWDFVGLASEMSALLACFARPACRHETSCTGHFGNDPTMPNSSRTRCG